MTFELASKTVIRWLCLLSVFAHAVLSVSPLQAGLSLHQEALNFEQQARDAIRQEQPVRAAQALAEADKRWRRLRTKKTDSTRRLFGLTVPERASLLLQLGMPAAAQAQLKRIHGSEAPIGSLFERTLAQARIDVAQHRLDSALLQIERAERQLTGLVMPAQRFVLLQHQLEALLALGRSADALALVQVYGRPSPDEGGEALIPVLAQAQLQQGARDKALAVLQHHQGELDKSPMVRTRLEAALLRTELLLDLRQLQDASQWVEKCRVIMLNVETPDLQVRFALLSARYEGLQGKWEDALARLQQALQRLQETTKQQEETGSLGTLLLPLTGTIVSQSVLQRPLETYELRLIAEQAAVLRRLKSWQALLTLVAPYLTERYTTRPGESTLRLLTEALNAALELEAARQKVPALPGLTRAPLQHVASLLKAWRKQNPASPLGSMAALEVQARVSQRAGRTGEAMELLTQAVELELSVLQHTPDSWVERAQRAETFARVREQLFALQVKAGRWGEALALQEAGRGHLLGASSVLGITAELPLTEAEQETLRRLSAELAHLTERVEFSQSGRPTYTTTSTFTSERRTPLAWWARVWPSGACGRS